MKMKNVVKIMMLALALFITQQGFAQSNSIQAGDQTVSLNLGYIAPTNDIENEDWSKDGFTLGVQYVYYVADRFALGAEIGQNWFSKYKVDDDSVRASITNFLLTARYNLLDENGTRLYIPASIGVARTKVDILILGDSISRSDTNLAWNAGLGFEHDIQENVSLGLEVRFNQTSFKELGLDHHLDYTSALLKISRRF